MVACKLMPVYTSRLGNLDDRPLAFVSGNGCYFRGESRESRGYLLGRERKDIVGAYAITRRYGGLAGVQIRKDNIAEGGRRGGYNRTASGPAEVPEGYRGKFEVRRGVFILSVVSIQKLPISHFGLQRRIGDIARRKIHQSKICGFCNEKMEGL